jgi:hypothetical protein
MREIQHFDACITHERERERENDILSVVEIQHFDACITHERERERERMIYYQS